MKVSYFKKSCFTTAQCIIRLLVNRSYNSECISHKISLNTWRGGLKSLRLSRIGVCVVAVQCYKYYLIVKNFYHLFGWIAKSTKRCRKFGQRRITIRTMRIVWTRNWSTISSVLALRIYNRASVWMWWKGRWMTTNKNTLHFCEQSAAQIKKLPEVTRKNKNRGLMINKDKTNIMITDRARSIHKWTCCPSTRVGGSATGELQ